MTKPRPFGRHSARFVTPWLHRVHEALVRRVAFHPRIYAEIDVQNRVALTVQVQVAARLREHG